MTSGYRETLNCWPHTHHTLASLRGMLGRKTRATDISNIYGDMQQEPTGNGQFFIIRTISTTCIKYRRIIGYVSIGLTKRKRHCFTLVD